MSTPRKQTFVPAPLKGKEPIASFRVLSDQYFSVANELRTFAKRKDAASPSHFYVFPVVIMYMAALEAFLQENLTLSQFLLQERSSRSDVALLTKIELLKAQRPPYQDFKDWIKEIFLIYDPNGKGIDTSSPEYQNAIALKELRNSVAHYNPSFIEYMHWPMRLQEAFHRSKLDAVNAGWVSNFSCHEVADWSYRTVREFIELFCNSYMVENPFTSAAKVPFKWD